MRWDIFCRVIDNFGDVGVCWRLAADLAGRGETVRLWLDDASALTWLAPGATSGAFSGIEVQPWPAKAAAGTAGASAWCTETEPGDVVIEAFACDPPSAFVARMAARPAAQRPIWINLEYLSAEAWVERVHGLCSPQFNGPGAGLEKWFFHPGFTPATGGLLREPDWLARRTAFDRDAWLAARGWARRPDERVVFVFCYDNPALPALLNALPPQPTLLLLAQGPAQRIAAAVPEIPGQRRIALPWLSQTDFDHALWSADLNLVRGEDSLVRALWAGAPLVWQIYPQDDGVHAAKLQAFIDRFAAGANATNLAKATNPDHASANVSASVKECVSSLFCAWNGLAPWSDAATACLQTNALAEWRAACADWRDHLLAQDDLVTQLQRFVANKCESRGTSVPSPGGHARR